MTGWEDDEASGPFRKERERGGARGSSGWPQRLIGPGLILLAAAIAIAPILLHGTFCGDDFEFHAVGWFDVQHTWQQGVLYPHWMTSANYGAGEPRFMFYPPLTWMLGAALGFVLPWALVPVAMIFLFLTGTGLAVRRLARERLADAPATLAGSAAIFSGFTLFTAYERTAFAELTGGFWIPLILMYALREDVSIRSRRLLNGTVIPLALLLAGAWLSNGPVGVMASYLLAAVAAGTSVWANDWRPLGRAAMASALGIGVAGYSLIPAAYEQRWADLRAAVDYPVFAVQNNWLFARHTDALLAGFGMVLHRASMIAVCMIGVAVVSALILAARSSGEAGLGLRFTTPSQSARQDGAPRVTGSEVERPWSPRSPKARDRGHPVFWVVLAAIPVVVLLMQLPISLPVWNLLPKLRFLQYPWRWLLVVEAPMGILFAAAVWPRSAAHRTRRMVVAVLCACGFLITTTFAARSFLRVCAEGDTMADLLAMYQEGGVEGTDEYEPPGADHWTLAKGLPDGCLTDTFDTELGVTAPGAQTPEWNAAQGSCMATFDAAERGPESLKMTMDVPKPGFMILKLARYPAWRVTVNGRVTGDLPDRDDGLMAVPVPSGPVTLAVDWSATPDVLVGRSVSVAALAVIALMAVWERRRATMIEVPKTLHIEDARD